jgi:hypothetical protein
MTFHPDDAERKARARKRAIYPGEVIAARTPKPALYAELSPQERFAAMTKLCEAQWLASHRMIERKSRSEWPGESFRIERG